MSKRNELKEQSLNRILDAGAARLRQEGLSGAAIAKVMADAGLTRGAFYVHFANKGQLAMEALRHALRTNRLRWTGGLEPESWSQRLHRLARRYLTTAHRDAPAEGCALAAVASDAARSDDAFRTVYEEQLRQTLQSICCGGEAGLEPAQKQLEDAMALMALCIGGVLLARAVSDNELSEHMLRACAASAATLGAGPLQP